MSLCGEFVPIVLTLSSFFLCCAYLDTFDFMQITLLACSEGKHCNNVQKKVLYVE